MSLGYVFLIVCLISTIPHLTIFRDRVQVLIKAIQYSCEGIKSAFVSEVAFRQELLLFIVCVSVLFVLDVSNLERAVMISSLFLVLIVEIVNTAFETTIERISSEQHILSKKVKDLGSAAVFLSLINFLITWMIILTG
ncbi:MAG: diacylglycerol kinase [Wolbachia endosymbiont of Ephestia elutella]|uniref:Diacylglycerol kinase n=2 Tax=unclassified Wolbachia TaxID=2640676 RepID=A0AAU8MH36_9RICK